MGPGTRSTDLRLDRLRAFVLVARAGGFSRAGRQAGRTQSSLSQAVGLLEGDLGEPLFVRTGRDIRLTDAGRVLLEHAERALADVERGLAELAARRALTAGSLVVGTSDTLAAHLLPQAFATFRARHPGVELGLDNRPSPVLAARVAEGAVDLAVLSMPLPSSLRIAGRPADAELRLETLVSQRDVAVFAPGHALARRRRPTLSAIAEHPLLSLDSTTASRAFHDAHFARAGLSPRIAIEASSVEVLKRFAELDFGVAIVPDWSVRREIAAGTLVAAPVAGLPRRHVALATPTSGPLSPAARAFVAVLRETVTGQQSW